MIHQLSKARLNVTLAIVFALSGTATPANSQDQAFKNMYLKQQEHALSWLDIKQELLQIEMDYCENLRKIGSMTDPECVKARIGRCSLSQDFRRLGLQFNQDVLNAEAGVGVLVKSGTGHQLVQPEADDILWMKREALKYETEAANYQSYC